MTCLNLPSRLVLITFVMTCVLYTVLPTLAMAQTAGGSLAANERQITGGDLALISYVVLWVLVLGVVAVVFMRQIRLRRELVELERKLDKLAGIALAEEREP